jgi:solute carrier family 25 S-adenosylmethionine transporter 26
VAAAESGAAGGAGAAGAGGGASPDEAENFALSYWRTLHTIARDEGASALWVGLSPRIGKAVLSGAVQFGTYEVTKGSMSNFFAKSEKNR